MFMYMDIYKRFNYKNLAGGETLASLAAHEEWGKILMVRHRILCLSNFLVIEE